MAELTILIAARNAAATISRAVASCLPETGCPIVLVDDGSTDDTVRRARAVAKSRVRVIRAPSPGGIGRARQAGLDAVDTECAAWLDADDEWMPGRAARLARLLRGGADIAADAIELYDGPSGAWLRRLAVPAFLRRPGASVRLFERNFLPGDTQVAFRVAVYRGAGGYDGTVQGPESYDLLLRALRRGARMAFADEPGYRMFAYPGSLSRNLDRQRAALAAVLRKHAYADVRALYDAAGYSPRIAAWALVMMAQFRGDLSSALAFLDEASPGDANPREVLEPDGPWPQCEGWRRAFQRGTILLQSGADDGAAAAELQQAEAWEPTPEGANNLGVALWRIGRRAAARQAFARASARLAGYHDARVNAASATPSRITTHPLRRLPSRTDYADGRSDGMSVDRP